MSDGLGSMSRSMLGIVGLDGSNTELSWKITKGKRSRKSLTGTGLSNISCENPTRVEESSGSDTDKIDEPSLADGLGCCVPIKKRRHLLHSPSRTVEQLPPQHGTPSLHFKNFQQLSDNIGLSCNESPDLDSVIQRVAGVLENNSDDTANLSGIALLATAACSNNINAIPDSVKQDFTEASLTLMKCNDTFNVSIPVGETIQVQGGLDVGHEKSSLSFAENSSDHILAENNQETSKSISVSSKINRCHWDLNKVMEEWEVPHEDLVGKKNSVGEASMEERFLAQSDPVSNGNNVNLVSLAPVDLATASFKSKVGGYAHEIDDNELVGPTLLKNYEQQTSLPVIEGLEIPLNNSQMKDAEEDSQKTSELSEVKTMDIGLLRKCKDMSTSEISIADQSAVCGGDAMDREENAIVTDAMDREENAIVTNAMDREENAIVTDAMDREENAIVTDAMDTDVALDHQDHLVSMGEIVKTSISQDSVKTLIDDDHGLSDGTQNISELQVDYDSPYEDGELRVPALYSHGRKEILSDEEENECVDFESDGIIVGGDESDLGNYPCSEEVEVGSEGSQAPEKKNYSMPAQISESFTRNNSLNFKKVMEENTVVMVKPEEKRHSNQGSGTTDELPIIPLVQDNHNYSMRGERKFDYADRFNSRGGSYPRDVGELTLEKSQFNISNMSSKSGDSFSRSGRGRGGADRSMTRRGSTFSHWNHRDSTNCYRSRGPEDHWQQTRTRNAADYIDKFEDDNSYEHDDHLSKYPSKGIQRPYFRRRSPVERDDYYGDHRRFNPADGYNNKRGSLGKFSRGGFGRGGRRGEEEYVDDDASSGRFSGYLSRGGERTSQISDMNWKSRSRSRTKSPHAWQSQRERNPNTRRCSRSRSRSPPGEFRQESRGHVPFQKRITMERFISPPKARFSQTGNNRWVNDNNRNFVNSSRSPPPPPPPVVRVFRRSQRFGGQSGRENNNNSNNNNNNKSEDNSSDGKQDKRFGLVDHNVRHSGTSNIMRRPRHDDTSVNSEDISNNNDGAADYEESFLSSKHNNNNNNDSPFSRHPGMVKRTQKLKQDDYFRSVTRTGR